MLAGGRSDRFGSEKALHVWRGRALIDNVTAVIQAVLDPTEIWIGVARVGASPSLTDHFMGQEGFTFIEDDARAEGPIAALAAASAFAHHRDIPWLLVVSCDMPAMSMQLLARMVEVALDEGEGRSAIVPRIPDLLRPRYEPLHALYRPASLSPALDQAIERDDRKLQHLLRDLPDKLVLDSDRLEEMDADWRRALTNVNTRGDLARLADQ